MAFAPSKRTRKRGGGEDKVDLSAMMDLMTIMLLFLLKSYSSTGALLEQYMAIELPESTIQEAPRKALGVIISKQEGLLRDIAGEVKPPIAPIEEFLDEESPVLPTFEDFVLEVQEQDRYLGKDVTDEVTIQAGSDVPYSWILKVTKTGEVTGITKYNFVVIKTEG